MILVNLDFFFLHFTDHSDLGGESQKAPKSPKSASNCQSSNSCTESEVAISTSDFVSLVHKVFGGKLQTTYQCSNCKSISLHKEGFTDLHLAFPEKNSSNSQGQEGSSSAPPQASVPLTMQKLLENYLKPEILQVSTWYLIYCLLKLRLRLDFQVAH